MLIVVVITEFLLHSATFDFIVRLTFNAESIFHGFVWNTLTLLTIIVVLTFNVSFADSTIRLFQSVKVLFSIIFLPVIESIGTLFIFPVSITSENAESRFGM